MSDITKSSRKMVGQSLQFFLFLVVASEFFTRLGMVNAFSTIPLKLYPSHTFLCTRKGHVKICGRQQRETQRGQRLFSATPPLSPLSNNDDYDYDDFTTEEVTNMHNAIVSLSEEFDDDVRRARLQQIMEAALSGPERGSKRFVVLFDRVLTQVGEKVQQEAREKYAEQPAALADESTEDGDNSTEPVSENDEDENAENNPEDKEPRQKSLDELKLWSLVDMMIQSKTIIKKNKS
uniref:Uncharacterized protein n=1 Tax=Pseudo-nitzschia australis TaxID=44445 RepID=A0A7S4AGJ8_9STRA|mmetsp:Transcript_5349/g.11783  ORF Transcript_5349/g.11783 Transcript_5349/m.11783 type:complete len:235 (-) Transcript_5349:1661-2365(-)